MVQVQVCMGLSPPEERASTGAARIQLKAPFGRKWHGSNFDRSVFVACTYLKHEHGTQQPEWFLSPWRESHGGL